MGRTSDAKQRLLDSGRELIHQRGYTAVGVSELCAAAGVKKGSFYHFFPSKLELALDVVDGYWQDSLPIYEGLQDTSKTPLERLDAYAARVEQHHTSHFQECGQVLGCPLGNLALEMSTQEPELQSRLQRRFNDTLGYLEKLIEEAIERGDIAPLNVTETAVSMLGHVEGSILMSKMRNDTSPLAQLGPSLRRLMGAAGPTTSNPSTST